MLEMRKLVCLLIGFVAEVVTTSTYIISRCVLGEKFEDENGRSRFGDVSRKILVLIAAFLCWGFLPCFWMG